MEHCGLRSRLFCLQGRRSPEWTKTPKLQRSDLNRYDSPCIGTVFSLLLCITKIHDPLISGFEPYYKFPTFAFATEINCCVGHISCVQDTFLWTRFLDHVSYLILPKVSRFSFEIENVGLEPLLCVPNAACFLNTSFSATPAGIEPAPPERQSGVLTVIRWSYIFFLFPSIEKAACLFGQAAFQHQSLQSIWLSRGSHKGSRSQTSTWSGLMKAYTNKPFRMHCGRHNRALEIKQAICIFNSVCIHLQHSLSFPDLWSFFTAPNITLVVSAVIQLVV